MYNLKKLRPVRIDDLIRVGKNADGGYVISKRQMEKTGFLLSFGINEDWSFEKDFLCRKGSILYAYDYSVSRSIFRSKSIDHFFLMISYLLRFNISKAHVHGGRWWNLRRRAKEFSQFFREKEHRIFIPKFLGDCDNETFTQFDAVFGKLPSTIEDLSVFIKMDIENWEYRALPLLAPYFDKLNGIAIEFHMLDIAEKKFEEIMDMLSARFAIAHVHANNNGGLIRNSDLPVLLEITLINKALVADPPVLSSQSYPIKGLDFPNVNKPDIALHF